MSQRQHVLNDVWDVGTLAWVRMNQPVISTDTLTVSLAGVSTAANQTTGNTSLSSIDGKLPALIASRVPVDGSGVTQPVSGTITANAGTGTLAVSMAAVPTGGVALADTFKTRSDTYTVTGNGVTITVTSAPLTVFSVQVKGTGAVPTSWDVRLEGSLDGTNFSQILAHTTATGDGAVLWSGSVLSPSLYIRSRAAGLVLGSATNIVTTILGTA